MSLARLLHASFLLENKSALLPLSLFPSLTFQNHLGKLPRALSEVSQPDSLCCSNEMAPQRRV